MKNKFQRSDTGRYFVIWPSLMTEIRAKGKDGWNGYTHTLNDTTHAFLDLYDEMGWIITEEEVEKIAQGS